MLPAAGGDGGSGGLHQSLVFTQSEGVAGGGLLHGSGAAEYPIPDGADEDEEDGTDQRDRSHLREEEESRRNAEDLSGGIQR